jgi:hypothetical protein
MKLVFTLWAAALLMIVPSTAMAKSNLLFVLDASNSMWGKVDGVTKIETAKKAFSTLISEIPKEMVNIFLLIVQKALAKQLPKS